MIGGGVWLDLVTLPRPSLTPSSRGPDGSSPACSTLPAPSPRWADGYRVEGRGASPAVASMPTGSTATAWRDSSTVTPCCVARWSGPTTSRIEPPGPPPGCRDCEPPLPPRRCVRTRRANLRAARGRTLHRRPDGTIPAPFVSLIVSSVAIGIARGALRRHPRSHRRQGPAARRRAARHESRTSSGRSPSPTPSYARPAASCTRPRRRRGTPRYRVRPYARAAHGPRRRRVGDRTRHPHRRYGAHRLGGGTAVYADSPLQRRLPRRPHPDATLHRPPRHHQHPGAVLLGGEPDVPVF